MPVSRSNATLLLLKGDLDLFFDHLRRLEDTTKSTAQEEIQLYQNEAEKLRTSPANAQAPPPTTSAI